MALAWYHSYKRVLLTEWYLVADGPGSARRLTRKAALPVWLVQAGDAVESFCRVKLTFCVCCGFSGAQGVELSEADNVCISSITATQHDPHGPDTNRGRLGVRVASMARPLRLSLLLPTCKHGAHLSRLPPEAVRGILSKQRASRHASHTHMRLC